MDNFNNNPQAQNNSQLKTEQSQKTQSLQQDYNEPKIEKKSNFFSKRTNVNQMQNQVQQDNIFNMIEISLVPDLKRDLLKAEKLRKQAIFISALVMSISLAITVILSTIAYGTQSSKIKDIDSSVNRTLSNIKNMKGVDEILAVQRQMTKLNELHSEKLISSRIFMIIDRIVAGNSQKKSESSLSEMSIVINKMEVDLENNKIVISGETEKGYVALEKLQKTLSETKVKYKTVSNKSKTSDDTEEDNQPEIYPFTEKVALESFPSLDDKDGKNSLTFKISFVINEYYFKNRENTIVSLSGVDRKDVTDSYLAIPDSLFSNSKEENEEKLKEIQETSNLINNNQTKRESDNE